MKNLKNNIPDINRVKELLDYNPATGIFTWKKVTSNRVKVGSLAGTMMVEGYITISFDCNAYYAHRLAWYYINSYWPREDIDHINNIRNDNRIENLRLASRQQNTLNTLKRSDNTSGYKGVSFMKSHNKWVGECRFKGKRFHQYFSSAEEANEAVKKFREKMHKEFSNHG